MKRRFACAIATTLLVSPLAATAAELPDYLWSTRSTQQPPSMRELATRDILQLNTSMFSLYKSASRIFHRNILDRHPVVLALFTGSGGRMILYRPGEAPEEAPPVPVAYQVQKSLGHSTMAVAAVVLPYVDRPEDRSWVAPLRAYLEEMQSALDGIAAADMPDEWRGNSRAILENNIAFMQNSLAAGEIRFDAVQAFAEAQSPHLQTAIAWAAQTQVKHWMQVLDGWQRDLGGSFDAAFAATNTIYVTRQNNILFSVLAQYFGAEAINDRLILIETTSFTTTPEELQASLVRIVADRAIGGLFFGHDRLMDFELMGGDARRAIAAEMSLRGREAILPPEVPFGSRQWPTLISGAPGPASLHDLR
jgi:hypothetical protein